MKQCTKCKQVKSLDQFYKNTKCKNRLHSQCKSCIISNTANYYRLHKQEMRKWQQEYYIINRKRIQQRNQKWNANHQEQVAKRNQEWVKVNRERHNELSKKWKQLNPEKNRETNKKWRENNVEQYRAANKQYQKTHRENCNKKAKKWRSKHPEQVRLDTCQRRARKWNAMGCYTIRDQICIRIEQGDKCYYCKTSLNGKGHWEHKIPLSREGTNWPNNMCWACPKCNQQKYTQTDVEFFAFLGQQKLLEISSKSMVSSIGGI